jgi:Rrf2 family transcriptional regulator, iron-sulfur cluster assembly transcription factor
MRLTTKGRLAVLAMIDLALRQQRGPVPLVAISVRQSISLSYLEQLFGKLRRHALVKSARGPGGGYRLGRDAGDISVADITLAVDDSFVQMVPTPDMPSATQGSGERVVDDLWAGIQHRVLEHMRSITLRQLADDQLARGVSIEDAPIRPAVYPRPPVAMPAATGANSVFAWSRYC